MMKPIVNLILSTIEKTIVEIPDAQKEEAKRLLGELIRQAAKGAVEGLKNNNIK